MPTPFRDLHNNSNASASSYETAWSSSFSNRRSMNDSRANLKDIKNEPINEDDVSILENNISMMSKEEERELLRKLYPEMFEDSPQPPRKPNKTVREVKREPISDYEDDDKENLPPEEKFKKEKEIPPKKPKERSKRIQISSDSENDEAAFDDYLKKLRNPMEPAKVERKVSVRKNFVVDDDYISEESDFSSESESEDDLEDEYRTSSLETKARPAQKKKRASDDEEWFLQSLTENFSGPIHNEAKVYVKENALRQKKHRETLLIRLQDILIRRIFSDIPSEKLKLEWNARLRKSAGQCRNHSNGNSTIEMSPVVCTTAERVRDTLIHEMCHAAVWVVDRLHKEGHGPGWKRWGARCSSAFRSLPFVERCHSYEIEAKFFYVCENVDCGQEIKRQSKSLDTSRKACGKCLGRFVLYRFCRRTNTRIVVEDPKAKTPTAPTASPSPPLSKRNVKRNDDDDFADYAKENYWKFNNMKHSEVMEKLREEFKQIKSK
ncbi:unnamed protein product [Caenorhabditis sp. 36 PRJEB53466]|nr:unnamed protein product [Caenorhabditis sp. 36 PRJEB53466]